MGGGITAAREEIHMEIKRGQIYYADLSPVVGSEQGGIRPVLIVSNDIGNNKSPVVIVAPITSVIGKKKLPTQILIGTESGLKVLSMAMCEQLRTIDKRRLSFGCVGTVPPWLMKAVNKALKISVGC